MKPRIYSNGSRSKYLSAWAGTLDPTQAAILLKELRAERRELKRAIVHLERLQVLRGARPGRSTRDISDSTRR